VDSTSATVELIGCLLPGDEADCPRQVIAGVQHTIPKSDTSLKLPTSYFRHNT
jgi:hypothetical protein